MQTALYVLAALVIGYALAQIIAIRKQGDITETGWRQIRNIIFAAVEDVFNLYNASRLSAEEMTDEAVRIVRTKIEQSQLPAADKAFWTTARLRWIIAPVIEALWRKMTAA